jgi:hypothetical protein
MRPAVIPARLKRDEKERAEAKGADVILGYGPGVDPAAPIFAQDVDRG